jgi:hypothetical protein
MDGHQSVVATDRDPHTGRFVAGNHGRFTKQLKIAAKAEELRHEYFPGGGETVMDVSSAFIGSPLGYYKKRRERKNRRGTGARWARRLGV